jgi:capsular exopolysaccharide synthesis family protein
MELKLIFTIFRRWAWLMIIGAVIGAGAAYIFSIYQSPVYEATTKFMVLTVPDSGVSEIQIVSDKELAETYIELLKTQPVLDAASELAGTTVRASQITASRVPSTRLIEVTVRAGDAQEAALIANTLVDVLARQNESLQASRYSSTEESLQLQVQEIEQEISQLQDQLTQRSEQSITDLEQQVEQQKVELEQRIFQLQAEIAPLQQEIDDLIPDALPNQLPPPLTTEQRNLLNQKRTELAQKQFVLDLATETYYRLTLPEGGAAAPDAPAPSVQAVEDFQQANLALYQQIYSTLLSNYEAVRLARLQNTPNIVSVERAVAPALPILPQPIRNAILGGIVGLVIAGSLAFVIEYLDDTLKTPADISLHLGLPVVGYVFSESGLEKTEGLPFVAANPRSPVAETFRTLRTNLEFASVDKPLKTILVSSPGPGEGKTTVSTNLAAAMAQANKRVILLEGDLRRPRLHKAMGMSNQVGLSEVFRGQMDIRDVARYSKVKDLAVITSGSLPPNPAELLGSTRMKQILARLEESASVVIIDSPPFVVTDSTVLAAKVDGVLLVIQPGKTHAEAAKAMLTQLERAGARVIGVVLNRVPRKGRSYYGGYYYNYDSDKSYSLDNTAVQESDSSAGKSKSITNLFGARPATGKIGEEA